MEQEGSAGQDDQKGARDHGDAMALQEVVDGGEDLEADRSRLSRRIEGRDHRRYERDAAEKGDQHPAPGNEAKLGKATIAGGEEGEESDGGGRGRQRQRRSSLASRAAQR